MIVMMMVLLLPMNTQAAARAVAEVDLLSDHSARITLNWSNGREGTDILITGWTFEERGLTVTYQTGVNASGFNSRTMEHESYRFPMPIFLELSGANTPIFNDLSNQDEGHDSIMNLYHRGVISGYPDGSFKAGNPVTRAEFSKMLLSTAAYEPNMEAASVFDDVAAGHWARPYIMTLSGKGIVNGKGEGKFDPEGQIKTGEVLAVLTRTFDLYGEQSTYGYILAQHWSNTYFLQAVADGIVVPTDKIYNNYNAEIPATRELCAVLLSRVLENLHDVEE